MPPTFCHVFFSQIHSKMPRNICCDPYGVHKYKVSKLLRKVTDVMAAVSNLVSEGDFICCNCRAKLTAPPKVVPPTSDPSMLDPPNPEPPNPVPPIPEPLIPEPSRPEPSTSEQTQGGSSAATSVEIHPLPSTSGTQNGAELSYEVSTDESFIGDSAEESAEESTADEYIPAFDSKTTPQIVNRFSTDSQPILNQVLPALGQSPVKRSK